MTSQLRSGARSKMQPSGGPPRTSSSTWCSSEVKLPSDRWSEVRPFSGDDAQSLTSAETLGGSYTATTLILDATNLYGGLPQLDSTPSFLALENNNADDTNSFALLDSNDLDDLVETDLPLTQDFYLDSNSPADSLVWSPDFGLDLDVGPLDDILACKKGDRTCDPTLAELNANDKPLLDELDLVTLPLAGVDGIVNLQAIQLVSEAAPNARDVPDVASLSSTEPNTSGSTLGRRHSTLHRLLMQEPIPLDAPAIAPASGAEEGSGHVPEVPPVGSGNEKPPGRMRAISMSEASAGDGVSTSGDGDSHDEGFDSEPDDSDQYNDCFSDGESLLGSDELEDEASSQVSGVGRKLRRKERYFWQYNLQSKGPKGSRIPLQTDEHDPHFLNEVADPVFSTVCQVQGIKHSGKARRGDGNDLTPSPVKLFHIGQELRKLSKVINDLVPVSELPFNARPKSRKEKNKLASRACRLKKKAQHEANKLKLFGLEQEHRRLMYVLDEVKALIVERVKKPSHRAGREELMTALERLSKNYLKIKVAGHSVEFVNHILDRVATGSPSGGLEQL